ncbi:recombinase family protein [Microseira sp. BLCC-F43]|jgi:DNA invertase Pin-like site-specific DNA recombinase|uniref:recombinase family protein n=1 Tax=Microseira sp. BLCC-F43 TaxID=3153602 RepID=UPI0035BAA918
MTAEDFQNLTTWERLERGRKLKAAQGGYAGYGSPAFGQTSVNGELVENPVEMQVIELIRRHHKSGKSLQQIADWLNQQGYCTKRGQQWKRISVKRVLDRLYGKTPKVSSATQTRKTTGTGSDPSAP